MSTKEAPRAAPEVVTLASRKPGQSGRVARIEVPSGDRARLLEMGMTAGAEVTVIRFAPMGDPIEVRLRGYSLSLRRSEAEQIWIAVQP